MINQQKSDVRKKIQYFQNFQQPLWLAITYHKTHRNNNITFDKHKYLIDIYEDKSDDINIMKSTQCGISEWLIIYAIAEAMAGRSVLYALPIRDIMRRFVLNRFNKSIQYTMYYQTLIKDGKSTESMDLKDIGDGVISFAGSNTPNPFIEFPADTYIIDEKDRGNQTHLMMGEERLDASENPKRIKSSNPTITNFGIHTDILNSDYKEWHIHADCGHWINMDFFTHIVKKVDDEDDTDDYIVLDKEWDRFSGRDIRPICDKCGKPFDRYGDGEYVARQRHTNSGYHISKLYSTNALLSKLVENFEKGLVNPLKMERFYNADLGLPFQGSGSKVFEYMLDACVQQYSSYPYLKEGVGIIGIDVGKVMHVIIGRALPDILQIVYIGTVFEEEDIWDLWKRFRCVAGVIDAQPEIRMSKRLCRKYKGMFRWMKYSERADKIDPKDKVVLAYRTGILDAVKEAILTKSIMLPKESRNIEDFYSQMCASTRVYNEDKEMYEWQEGDKPDHYMFSMAFLLLARKILLMRR